MGIYTQKHQALFEFSLVLLNLLIGEGYNETDQLSPDELKNGCNGKQISNIAAFFPVVVDFDSNRRNNFMKIPEFVAREEVQRICQELGIRDWTKLSDSQVLFEEAKVIQVEVGAEAQEIPTEWFQQGLEVELEHGIRFPDANVTNNHPLLTGKIVLAHLKEMLDYYLRLEVAELEGDLLKASRKGDSEKLAQVYKKLIFAKAKLSEWEESKLHV